jgi:O-antigen ligase
VYLIVGVFVVACAAALAMQWYAVALVPLLPLAVYTLMYKPEWLWYGLFLAVPLSINIKDLGGGFGLAIPTEPIIFLLVAGLAIKIAGGNGVPQNILKHPLSIIIMVDLTWILVTSISSTMPLISFKYLISRFWYILLFYFITVSIGLKDKRAFQKAFTLMLVTTLILVAYTLRTQAEGGFSRSWAYAAMRPFLPDHGMYGAFISFFIPPLLVVTLFPRKFSLSPIASVITGGLLAYLLFAVGVSYTRASWLSILASFAIFGCLLLKIQFKTLIIGGVLIAGGALLFQDQILTELSRNKKESDDDIENHVKSVSNISSDPSNLERLNRWSSAYRMFLDKPVLGFGPGTYTFQYAPYQISSEMSIISTHAGDQGNVHSEYLRPLCESGFLGLLTVLAIVLFSTWMGFDTYYRAQDPYVKYAAMAILLGLMTYYVHGFLNNYIEFDKLAIPFWSFNGFLTALHMRARRQQEQ